MPKLVTANSSDVRQRRAFFDVRGFDGITPILTENGQQPFISVNGLGNWTSIGIGLLTHIGFGRYYADLDLNIISNPGDTIETRYKGNTTAETPGDSFQVVGFSITEPNLGVPLQIGAGATPYTLIILDRQTKPIQGAGVWISTDVNGQNIIAGTLHTDFEGKVTFYLDLGQYYYAWVDSSEANFRNPTRFQVRLEN